MLKLMSLIQATGVTGDFSALLLAAGEGAGEVEQAELEGNAVLSGLREWHDKLSLDRGEARDSLRRVMGEALLLASTSGADLYPLTEHVSVSIREGFTVYRGDPDFYTVMQVQAPHIFMTETGEKPHIDTHTEFTEGQEEALILTAWQVHDDICRDLAAQKRDSRFTPKEMARQVEEAYGW